MRRNNKSSVYGYYGGVSNEDFYVPPGSPSYVPKPAKKSFTEEDRKLIDMALPSIEYVMANAPNIMLRVTQHSSANNIDTFVITTSGRPEDIIVYTSNEDRVVLDDLAGTGLADTNQQPIDGGSF